MFNRYLFLILIGIFITSTTATAESIFLKKFIPVSDACSFEGHQNMLKIVKKAKVTSEVLKILVKEQKAGRCIHFKPPLIIEPTEVEFFATITRSGEMFDVHNCKFEYENKTLWTLWHTKINEM